MSNMIKLIYSLNNEESSVSFDSSNKISTLKTLINLTQKINLDDYEVYYKKKQIKWDDETPIKTIIGKENVPIFYIKLKTSKTNENSKKDEKKTENKNIKEVDIKSKEENNKSQDNKADNKSATKKDDKKADPKTQNSKDEPKKDDKKADPKTQNSKDEPKKEEKKPDPKTQNSKDESKKDSKSPYTKDFNIKDDKKAEIKNNPKEDIKTSQDQEMKHNTTNTKGNVANETHKENTLVNLKCKVIVENFPSRPEFFDLIEKFEDNKNAKDEMSLLNTNSGVEIKFKNPVKHD